MLLIFKTLSGGESEEVTPVPMPNTEVKFFSANGSWGLPPARVGRCQARVFSYEVLKDKRITSFFNIMELFHSSSVVEQSAVNRSVVGSNPTCGAIWRAVREAEGARLEIV